MASKKAYVIGIGGRTTSSLAKMLADAGWQVSGADQGVYPPSSTYLEQNHIPFHTVYDASHITSDLDLVMIGGNAMHVMAVNPEVERAKELGLTIKSYPEVLHDILEKLESIVITGTYGKTTTCAILAWIMDAAGLNPSFDISEIANNFPDGTRLTDSRYSIIHGDEHPTQGYSQLPKFAYFMPKYILHTATLWDHFNIYPTEESFIKVFQEAISKLPTDGWLLSCLEGANNQLVAQSATCPVFWYSTSNPEADFYAEQIRFDQGIMKFTFIEKSTKQRTEMELPQVGQHNVENAVAASAMARLLKIDAYVIQQALKTFKGLKRHLEFVASISPPLDKGRLGGVTNSNTNDIRIYLDQGQHPAKFKAAVDSLRQAYSDHRIIAILDTHASVLHHKESLNWYDHAFDDADQVIVAQIKLRKLQPGEAKQDRVTGKRVVNAIRRTQKHVTYIPVDDQILTYLQKKVQPGDVILFLSSGNFRGLIEKTTEVLS